MASRSKGKGVKIISKKATSIAAVLPSTPSAHIPTSGPSLSEKYEEHPEILTIESILSKVANWLNLTNEQRLLLANAKYDNGEKIVDINRIDIIYEVVNIIHQIGFDETMKYLSTTKSPDMLMWESPTLQKARDKFYVDLEISKEKERGIKGVGRCGKCGGTELAIHEQQTRSADEAMTVFFRCIQCNNRWKR